MIPVLSVDLMRRSDAKATLVTSAEELMRRAGEGMVRALLAQCSSLTSAAVICGSGNNAGDGYVMALLLREREIPVTVYTLSERETAAGAYWAKKCREAGIPFLP